MRIVRFLLLFVGLASQKSPHPGGPRLGGQLCDYMGDLIGGIVVKFLFWQKSGGRDFKLFFITIVTQPSSQEAKNKWYFTLTQNFTLNNSTFLDCERHAGETRCTDQLWQLWKFGQAMSSRPCKVFRKHGLHPQFQGKAVWDSKTGYTNTCFHLKLVDLCIISSDRGPWQLWEEIQTADKVCQSDKVFLHVLHAFKVSH